MFTGRAPFGASDDTAILMKITQQEAPRLLDVASHLPRPLTTLLGRMLALHTEDRYQDVRVILEDLQSYERRGLLPVSPAGALDRPQSASPVEHTRAVHFQPRRDGDTP